MKREIKRLIIEELDLRDRTRGRHRRRRAALRRRARPRFARRAAARDGDRGTLRSPDPRGRRSPSDLRVASTRLPSTSRAPKQPDDITRAHRCHRRGLRLRARSGRDIDLSALDRGRARLLAGQVVRRRRSAHQDRRRDRRSAGQRRRAARSGRSLVPQRRARRACRPRSARIGAARSRVRRSQSRSAHRPAACTRPRPFSVACIARRASDASARRLLSYPLSTTAERIAEVVGGVERIVTLCSACSSGANAIVQAAAWLRSGQARSVLAGGADGLCSLTFTGFNSLERSDRRPVPPVRRDTRRTEPGRGRGASWCSSSRAAARARGAKILPGCPAGQSAPKRITSRTPSRAARLLRGCFAEACGGRASSPAMSTTSTLTAPARRRTTPMEARAIRRRFRRGRRSRVDLVFEGAIGHTLAAAGAIEAALPCSRSSAECPLPAGSSSRIRRSAPSRDGGRPRREAARRGLEFVRIRRHRVRSGVRAAAGATAHRPTAARAPNGGDRDVRRRNPRCGDERASRGVRNRRSPGSASGAARGRPLEVSRSGRSRRFDRAAALVTAGVEQALASARLSSEGVGIVAGTRVRQSRAIRAIREALGRAGPALREPGRISASGAVRVLR